MMSSTTWTVPSGVGIWMGRMPSTTTVAAGERQRKRLIESGRAAGGPAGRPEGGKAGGEVGRQAQLCTWLTGLLQLNTKCSTCRASLHGSAPLVPAPGLARRGTRQPGAHRLVPGAAASGCSAARPPTQRARRTSPGPAQGAAQVLPVFMPMSKGPASRVIQARCQFECGPQRPTKTTASWVPGKCRHAGAPACAPGTVAPGPARRWRLSSGTRPGDSAPPVPPHAPAATAG